MKFFFLAALLSTILICSYTSRQFFNEPPKTIVQSGKDSGSLQHFLDQHYKTMAEYNEWSFLSKETEHINAELEIRKIAAKDSLKQAWANTIKWVRAQNDKATDEQIKKGLQSNMQKITSYEQLGKDLQEQMENNNNKIMQWDAQRNNSSGRYKELTAQLSVMVKHSAIAGELLVNNIRYRYFIVNKNLHNTRIHNTRPGAATIEATRQQLIKEKKEPLMITNGGMFAPGYKPVGLLIDGSKKYNNLDTLKPDNRQAQNFYLLPNGVFYIDASGSFNVMATDSFRCAGVAIQPTYATQSGPMLVSENVINSNFKPGSTNLNIRSGVGKIDDARCVFVISDEPVNFFDFTLALKEVFGCRNALYLDGAISKMYIEDKLLKKKSNYSGDFGPIISVTAKKK
jgi:uncharacterized protein YigE (DUF2233 family)